MRVSYSTFYLPIVSVETRKKFCGKILRYLIVFVLSEVTEVLRIGYFIHDTDSLLLKFRGYSHKGVDSK